MADVAVVEGGLALAARPPRRAGVHLLRVIPTCQDEAHFGRVYAAHGDVFIVLSLLWGRVVDRFEPDRWDITGAVICLVDVGVIFIGPRG